MAKLIGWREWASLPDLDIDRLKVKVDTGARTSALYASDVHTESVDGEEWVTFTVHPLQQNKKVSVNCRAPIKERRQVRDSGGHEEDRIVIDSTIKLGSEVWTIELTLTHRENMSFRMLLGRNAVRKRFYIDPTQSFLVSQPQADEPVYEEE